MAGHLPITLAVSALNDLEEIRSHYLEKQIPEVGEKLTRDIFNAMEGLGLFSDQGRIVPEFGQPLLRELIHPPFRIVYRRDPGRIRVVRIWRSERLLRFPEKNR
ncbi:MAG: type II toxin-antitoxin system RelE/ParE family toxin [Deltaproteobacteria bacterium]|nr:type II toxin-antitoxin system RelE/ParE family toxin [Deltaproteobacteria bacterium]